MMFKYMGKFFIIIGIVLIIVGLLMNFGSKIPYLGKLPGDISIEKENFKFYFPITTSIIISIILTLVLYLISRFKI